MNKRVFKSLAILLIAFSGAVGSTGAYFSDTEISLNNQFTAGYWEANKSIVINEVYYDTNGRTYDQGNGVKTEKEGDNEWVELFNPNNFEINLKNYKIGNSTKEFTINPNVSIPARGFALLSHDNNTWHFWSDPDSLTVNLGGNVGNGWLKNDGDLIYLKDSNGNIIDQMSYGSNTAAYDPSSTDANEGHSLERDPVGKDTNSAVDFVDKTNPTPGS